VRAYGFMTCFCVAVCSGEVDTFLAFYYRWFYLNVLVNVENNLCCSADGASYIKLKFGVWCAVSAIIIIEHIPIMSEDRIISRNLWPARSPDPMPNDDYLWGKSETQCM